MKKYLSMVALALVGALMTGCSSDDNEPQQPANTGNVETLTLTVSLDGEGTRALTSEGVKTFAAGDQIAVVYKNTDNETVKTVSNALSVGGSTATFTVTVENADKSQNVTYIYPASMANTDGSINYAALATQDGTLATLSSNLDLATYTGAWSGTSLPSNVELDNQLAILQLTIKDNAATPNEITNTITGMTISDGTNTYTVSRSAADGPIYVAIQPTSSANIEVTATDGTANYTKSLTGKTYAAGNFYNHGWRMAEQATAKALSAATSEDIGKIAGADGYIYDTKDDAEAEAEGNAIAMIAYVGTASDFTHGLAIALEDLSTNTSYNWSNAPGAVTAWASHKTATTGSWRLPSIMDWQYILIGCGASGSYSANPEKLSYSGLFSKLETAGATALKNNTYWSSTERSDDNTKAWRSKFENSGENSGYATFRGSTKTTTWYVRACLAF